MKRTFVHSIAAAILAALLISPAVVHGSPKETLSVEASVEAVPSTDTATELVLHRPQMEAVQPESPVYRPDVHKYTIIRPVYRPDLDRIEIRNLNNVSGDSMPEETPSGTKPNRVFRTSNI